MTPRDHEILKAIREERRACADIAERIRKREWDTAISAGQVNLGAHLYVLLAEEIRDRILMRPAQSNSQWTALEPVKINKPKRKSKNQKSK